MNRENWPLVIDEPIEVKDFKKITDHFYEIYLISMKKNWKITTCDWLNLETLGFWPIMPKKLPQTLIRRLQPDLLASSIPFTLWLTSNQVGDTRSIWANLILIQDQQCPRRERSSLVVLQTLVSHRNYIWPGPCVRCGACFQEAICTQPTVSWMKTLLYGRLCTPTPTMRLQGLSYQL